MKNRNIINITLFILYLHYIHSLQHDIHKKQSNYVKYFSKNKEPKPALLDVFDNKDIDVDALKRRRVHIPRIKNSNDRKQHIGRASPTVGSYSRIGDGIYMLKDIPHKVDSSRKSAPQNVPSSNKIHTIDKDNQAIANDALNYKARFDALPYDDDYANIKDIAAHQSLQSNNVAFEGSNNLEGMNADDKIMLTNIENNLSVDDKMTGMNMAREAEAAHAHERILANPKGLNGFQKAILEGSKELQLASESERELYIKDAAQLEEMKRDIIQSRLRHDKDEKDNTERTVKSKVLDYADIDEIDSSADKRGFKKRRNRRKLHQQHKQANSRTLAKSKKNTHKQIFKLEGRQNARLIKALNNTDNSNPKLLLKSKSNTLKITNATLLHGSLDNGKKVLAFTNIKTNSTDSSDPQNSIQRRKSEVMEEEQVIGNKRYIASQALPENSNGFFENPPNEEQLENNFVNNQQKDIDARHAQFLQAASTDGATVNNQQESVTEVVPQKDITSNFGKASNAEMEDALADFNSAEIKSAMAESDLKNLNEIKTAVDEQNTKNAVDYFNQPQSNFNSKNSSEVTLGELSEEFREAQQDSNTIAKPKTEGFPVTTTGKVKQYVIHLPNGDKNEDATMETINEISENAEQLFSGKDKESSKGKDTSKSIEAASLLEKLLEQEAGIRSKKPTKKATTTTTTTTSQKKDKNIDDSLIEKIINSKAFKKLFSKSQSSDASSFFEGKTAEEDEADEASHSWHEVDSNTENEKAAESEPLGVGDRDVSSGAYKAFVRNVHRQALSGEKFQGSEGTMESFNKNEIHKLHIGGGKIVGGSVRGGNIQGGYISGGDVSGGEVDGGKISGGTFKGGVLAGGLVRDGIVEGGKIRGGQVMGGLVRSGLIDGGLIRGGIIEGGHLINGTIEGGDFKGGEMTGGKLVAGEIDGGIMKGGIVEGGTLKGGIIESGTLEGGVMLSGLLRGGVVKSGIIRGGIIDKGVVVQGNADIGPGVEIHGGIIKGGRITATHDRKAGSSVLTSSKRDGVHGGRIATKSEIFHLELEDDTADESKEVGIQENAKKKNNINKNGGEENGKKKNKINEKNEEEKAKKKDKVNKNTEEESKKKNKMSNKKAEEANSKKKDEINNNDEQSYHRHPTKSSIPSAKSHHKSYPSKASKRQERTGTKRQFQPPHNYMKQLEAAANIPQQQPTQEMYQQTQQQQYFQQPTNSVQSYAGQPTGSVDFSTPSAFRDKPLHWAMVGATRGVVLGETALSPKLRMSADGVTFRNGHAILDGVSGFFDAGDYRGECFSDPEVCDDGFTIHLTLKVYGDSVMSPKKLFILDSGAVSKDSRGISIWVSDGMIKGLIATRKQTYCISEDFTKFADRWLVLTLTWRSDAGASIYFDCEMFDQSQFHHTVECEPQCSDCHQMDVATRLMIGRPNKGPHFKVIHMAIGDILMFEKYHDADQVKVMCGTGNSPTQPWELPQTLSPQVITTQSPTQQQQGTQSGQQSGQTGQQGGQSGQQGTGTGQQGTESGQSGSETGQPGGQTAGEQPQPGGQTTWEQPQPTQPPETTVETTTTTTAQPTIGQFLSQEQRATLSAIAPMLTNNVNKLLQILPADDDDGPMGSQLYPSPQIRPVAPSQQRHLPTPPVEKKEKTPPAHSQGVSRSMRPLTKSQYPSPTVAKRKEKVMRPSMAEAKHKIGIQSIVYPTPPGLRDGSKTWLSYEPKPLIDYKTDRRSQLAKAKRYQKCQDEKCRERVHLSKKQTISGKKRIGKNPDSLWAQRRQMDVSWTSGSLNLKDFLVTGDATRSTKTLAI